MTNAKCPHFLYELRYIFFLRCTVHLWFFDGRFGLGRGRGSLTELVQPRSWSSVLIIVRFFTVDSFVFQILDGFLAPQTSLLQHFAHVYPSSSSSSPSPSSPTASYSSTFLFSISFSLLRLRLKCFGTTRSGR